MKASTRITTLERSHPHCGITMHKLQIGSGFPALLFAVGSSAIFRSACRRCGYSSRWQGSWALLSPLSCATCAASLSGNGLIVFVLPQRLAPVAPSGTCQSTS
jgi:hypothetical protein